MKYSKVCSSTDGESHFEDSELAFSPTDFAPPAPSIDTTQFTNAKNIGYIRCSPGWFGDWHPSPEHQVMLILSGKWEITVSDGETRILGPGSVTILEDTQGKGHRTRILGDDDGVVAVVQLEINDD